MINRKQLSATQIQFEDFAKSSNVPYVGQLLQVPMNCWGSVVENFEVISVMIKDDMVVANAVAV